MAVISGPQAKREKEPVCILWSENIRKHRIEKREQEFVKASLIYPDPGNQDIYEDDVLITGLAEEILYRSGFAQPETERL